MADKPALAQAVPATAAPAVQTPDRAFAWFTVAFGLPTCGPGVFPPLLPQIMDGLGCLAILAGVTLVPATTSAAASAPPPRC